MAFNNEIEEVKAQLKVLQSKLSFLEELEKTKTPVEECYKDWWGQYPETGTWDSFDDKRWQGFQAGYEFAYAISTAKEVMEKVQEEQKWDAVRESVKWCDEHPDESVEDYLTPQERGDRIHKEVENEIEKLQEKNWYVAEENEWKTVALLFGKKLPVIPPYGYDELSPNAWYMWVVFNYDYYIKQRDIESGRYPTPPQTPEQIEKSLRKAFKKVQQTEEWKETQRKIDAPKESWMNKPVEEPKPMDDAINRLLEKYKSQKLWNMLRNELGYSIDCCDEIVDLVERWLPKEQSAEGSQNAFAIDATEGFNHCLNKIKGTLR